MMEDENKRDEIKVLRRSPRLEKKTQEVTKSKKRKSKSSA